MTVHVVDNASTDGTPEMVREEFPEVVLHALDWNSGFCVANNIVLRESRADFVLLLNPDTEVYEGALDHMLRRDARAPGHRDVELPAGAARRHARPRLRSARSPLRSVRSRTSLGVGRSERARRSWLAQYRAPELGEYDAGEVDAVNGAFMLVRREALEDVGLLDEGYWLYMDDLDWCFRFKQKGWKVWYDGAVTVMHVKGGTTKRKRHRGLRHNVAFHRSMGRFYRKFYAGRNPLARRRRSTSRSWRSSPIAITRSAIARRSLA